MLSQLSVAEPQFTYCNLFFAVKLFASCAPSTCASIWGWACYAAHAVWQSAMANSRACRLHIQFLQFRFFLKAIPLLFALLTSKLYNLYITHLLRFTGCKTWVRSSPMCEVLLVGFVWLNLMRHHRFKKFGSFYSVILTGTKFNLIFL